MIDGREGPPPVRNMDGPTRKGIEEAIRFLSSGVQYAATVDDHAVVIVRLASRQPAFTIACATCSTYLAESVDLRRVYPAIFRHTAAPIPGAKES